MEELRDSLALSTWLDAGEYPGRLMRAANYGCQAIQVDLISTTDSTSGLSANPLAYGVLLKFGNGHQDEDLPGFMRISNRLGHASLAQRAPLQRMRRDHRLSAVSGLCFYRHEYIRSRDRHPTRLACRRQNSQFVYRPSQPRQLRRNRSRCELPPRRWAVLR